MAIRIKFLYVFLGIVVSFSSCQEKKQKDLWPLGVKYEAFVLAFADGNGDGKGDLKGLTQRLDYLKDLGVNGLWLMPIMPSPSYHKYDVSDYKAIHPDYGTMEDFKAFLEEAHKRGIRVVMDFVINHTASDHPWFLEAKKGKNNPYRNYYVWAKKDSIRDLLSKKKILLNSDNIHQWHPVNGDTLSEHYYGFFWGGMPDLNFDNPKVHAEVVEAGKFWLSMGVDGFRLDAARHIFPDERAEDNHNFWVSFRKEMEKVKPDVYLVGEVWTDAKTVAPYLKGLPALFNFDLGYAITAVASAGKDTLGLVKKFKDIRDYYASVTTDFIDATFIKNHDQNRILSELGGNKGKAKVAAGILFTLPGTPYVYYGEEIGMLGTKPDEQIREPFIWDNDKKDPLQTTWEAPVHSTDKTVVPFSQQKDDPNSLFNFYRDLIQYRNRSEALTRGGIEESGLQVEEVVSFIRKTEGEECLVLHNLSDVEVTVTLGEALGRFTKIDFGPQGIQVDNKAVTMPAFSTLVLTK